MKTQEIQKNQRASAFICVLFELYDLSVRRLARVTENCTTRSRNDKTAHSAGDIEKGCSNRCTRHYRL